MPVTHPVQSVVSLPDAALERWRDEYPYQLSPVRDDSPFFWHFTSFRDAVFDPRDKNASILARKNRPFMHPS